MNPFTKNLKWIGLLLICLLPIIWLGHYDVHPWGDDFAQYLKQAFNFANGIPYYRSTNVFNAQNSMYGPSQYPPLYSLLISPIVKVFGLSIKPLLLFNSFLLIAFSILSYQVYRQNLRPIYAIAVALLIGYNGSLLHLKTQLLSDLPCAVLILLYLVIRGSDVIKDYKKVIPLTIIGLAVVLTRTQYALLLLAELFYLFSRFVITKRFNATARISTKNVLLSAGIVLSSFIVYLILMHTVFSSPHDSLGYYHNLITNFSSITHEIDLNSEHIYFNLFNFFKFETKIPLLKVLNHLALISIFTLFVIGFLASLKKKFSFYHAFFIVVIIFHLMIPVRQGFRFLLPLLPLYLNYSVLGALQLNKILSRPLPKYIYPIGIILLLFTGKDHFGQLLKQPNIDSPYQEQDIECFDYLKKNISPDDLILFNKPRALSLYTQRKAMVLSWQVPFDKNLVTAQAHNAKYILIRKGLDEGWYQNFVWQTNCAKDSVQINDSYSLYTMN